MNVKLYGLHYLTTKVVSFDKLTNSEGRVDGTLGASWYEEPCEDCESEEKSE